MTTKFDIGDEIQFTLTGKIVEFLAMEDGACYTIELPSTAAEEEGRRIYLRDYLLEDACLRSKGYNVLEHMDDATKKLFEKIDRLLLNALQKDEQNK